MPRPRRRPRLARQTNMAKGCRDRFSLSWGAGAVSARARGAGAVSAGGLVARRGTLAPGTRLPPEAAVPNARVHGHLVHRC